MKKLILPLILLAAPAFAQQNCASRDAIVDMLANRYGETRQSIGLGGGYQVVETFANLETGTWTIVITSPNGETCAVAAGEQFQILNEELKTGVRA
jgi:hypothetical protein